MGLYVLFMSLLCFRKGTMLDNFHMCGIMLLLGAVLIIPCMVFQSVCVICRKLSPHLIVNTCSYSFPIRMNAYFVCDLSILLRKNSTKGCIPPSHTNF